MAEDKTDKPDRKKTIKSAFKADPADRSALPVLFQPEEMDIYCNKISLETFIFHGKPVEQDIERLEYDPGDHSVTVVKKDGTLMDLGVKIQWLVRPYFTKAKEIGIIRTKDGESIDGFYVPLVIKKTT